MKFSTINLWVLIFLPTFLSDSLTDLLKHFDQVKDKSQPLECLICFEEITAGAKSFSFHPEKSEVSLKHSLHLNCYIQYILKHQFRKCPVCRQELFLTSLTFPTSLVHVVDLEILASVHKEFYPFSIQEVNEILRIISERVKDVPFHKSSIVQQNGTSLWDLLRIRPFAGLKNCYDLNSKLKRRLKILEELENQTSIFTTDQESDLFFTQIAYLKLTLEGFAEMLKILKRSCNEHLLQNNIFLIQIHKLGYKMEFESILKKYDIQVVDGELMVIIATYMQDIYYLEKYSSFLNILPLTTISSLFLKISEPQMAEKVIIFIRNCTHETLKSSFVLQVFQRKTDNWDDFHCLLEYANEKDLGKIFIEICQKEDLGLFSVLLPQIHSEFILATAHSILSTASKNYSSECDQMFFKLGRDNIDLLALSLHANAQAGNVQMFKKLTKFVPSSSYLWVFCTDVHSLEFASANSIAALSYTKIKLRHYNEGILSLFFSRMIENWTINREIFWILNPPLLRLALVEAYYISDLSIASSICSALKVPIQKPLEIDELNNRMEIELENGRDPTDLLPNDCFLLAAMFREAINHRSNELIAFIHYNIDQKDYDLLGSSFLDAVSCQRESFRKDLMVDLPFDSIYWLFAIERLTTITQFNEMILAGPKFQSEMTEGQQAVLFDRIYHSILGQRNSGFFSEFSVWLDDLSQSQLRTLACAALKVKKYDLFEILLSHLD